MLVLDSGPDGAGRSPPACVDASIAAGITLKKSRRNLFPLILPSDGAEDGVSFHLYPVGGMKPETHYGYDYYIRRISVRRRAASNEIFFYIGLFLLQQAHFTVFVFCNGSTVNEN